MLAELTIALTAFEVLEKAISAGSTSFSAMGSTVDKLFDAEYKIKKQVEDEKSKVWGDVSEWESFQAQEEIARKHREFREVCIYSGRPNLYTDFLTFRAQNKRRRDEQIKEQNKAHNQQVANLEKIATTFWMMLGGAAVTAFFIFLISKIFF